MSSVVMTEVADLFHSFHMVPHSGGLHLRNANQQNEVSPVQCIVQSIRENKYSPHSYIFRCIQW